MKEADQSPGAYLGGQIRGAFTKVVSEKVEKGKQI